MLYTPRCKSSWGLASLAHWYLCYSPSTVGTFTADVTLLSESLHCHWQLLSSAKAEIATVILYKWRNSSPKKQSKEPFLSSPSCSLTRGSCFRSTRQRLPRHKAAAQEGQHNTVHSKPPALNYVPSSTSAPAVMRAQLYPWLIARSCSASSSLWEIACSDPAAGGDVSSREADCFLLSITSRELDSPVQIAGWKHK